MEKPKKQLVLDFKDVELRDVLLLMAKQIGKSLILSDDVKGTITARLVDVPVEKAMRILLESKGYTLIDTDGIYQIKSQRPIVAAQYGRKSGVELENEILQLEVEIKRLDDELALQYRSPQSTIPTALTPLYPPKKPELRQIFTGTKTSSQPTTPPLPSYMTLPWHNGDSKTFGSDGSTFNTFQWRNGDSTTFGSDSSRYNTFKALTEKTETDSPRGRYLGQLGGNKFDPDSTSNPFGAGNPFNPNSVKNDFGPYGSRFSPNSARNPFATDTPKLYDSQGNYRGKLSSNPFDPDSISNPFGRYGNRFSPDSVNNPFGAGNPFSPSSPRNPFGQGLSIYGDE